jgi:glycosyltransferase involved in cell wall biosynthesis
MRIGIEAQRLFRAKKHGMDVVALESIKALQQANSDHQFVVFVRPGEDSACISPSENVSIVEIPALSYADWELFKLPAAAEKHKVDILHCTSNTAPLGLTIPLVVTVHDIIYLEKSLAEMKSASFYQRMGQVYRKWNVPQVVHHADRVITVSEFERDTINRKISGIDHKLDVVYNGVSDRFFNFVPPWKRLDLKRRYGLPESYVLFLGNTDPKKNAANVLLAYAEYAANNPDHLPLVVADFDLDRIRQILTPAGYQHVMPSILQIGYVSPADMPLLYAGATVFLYPSLRESFGLPIIESMAASTPVITSDCASMPEVAGNAAILVDPEAPSHLAQMIRILVHDEALRTELRHRGRARARGFTWTNTATKLIEVYEEAASKSSRYRRAC